MEKIKRIRFVDTNDKPLFEIADGACVIEEFRNGEKTARDCKYIDETHLVFDGSVLHIDQLAEIIETRGSKVYPKPIPNFDNYKLFSVEDAFELEEILFSMNQLCQTSKAGESKSTRKLRMSFAKETEKIRRLMAAL